MLSGILSTERIALLLAYVAATVVAIVLVNAGDSNFAAIVLWWSVSVLIGWRWRTPWLGLLAAIAIPISIPFGYADHYEGSDAPWVPLFATVAGALSGCLIALSAISASFLASRRDRSAA